MESSAQNLPDVTPNTPTVGTLGDFSSIHTRPNGSPSITMPMSQKQRNALIRAEIDRNIEEEMQAEQRAKAIINDAISSLPERFRLPSKGNAEGEQHYRNAFEQLKQMGEEDFSIKRATHIIENAYFKDTYDYEEFNKTIAQTGDFLKNKMQELGYDRSNNLAKNFLLFQFFSDTLDIQSNKVKHLPLTYDFEDYMGKDDWTKMFVRKLLETGKGQCK